jgi:hypothetical protein
MSEVDQLRRRLDADVERKREPNMSASPALNMGSKATPKTTVAASPIMSPSLNTNSIKIRIAYQRALVLVTPTF